MALSSPTGDRFTKMGMPFDSITKVELEGDRGNIQAA